MRGFDRSVVKRPFRLRSMKRSGAMNDPFPSGMPKTVCASAGNFLSRSLAIVSGPIISIRGSMARTSSSTRGERRKYVWHRMIRSMSCGSMPVLLLSRQSIASFSSLLRMSDLEVVYAAKM